MSTTVVIERRFNGPPDSGNGGYSCGLLARAVEGPAEVSLRRPPPLDASLSVVRDGERLELRDGDEIVAEGASVGRERFAEPPAPVDVETARAADQRSTFRDDTHPFPTCFVCGPLRSEGDGLRIFPGRVPERAEQNLFACVWTPGGNDAVPVEIIWAALDCPTSAPLMNEPGPDGKVLPIVLARLAVDVRAEVEPGVEHVITSWEIARDGRKREAGAALYAPAGGEPLALARALWIELKPGG